MMELPDDESAYNDYIERMRKTEYPMLKAATYLDHAGTTLYSKSQMERFHAEMMANLFGNPHSASPSSVRTTQEVENVRLQLLRFFHADSDKFDLVFTANATAGIKLVGEAFREQPGGFSYAYHVACHTSLVGLREFTNDHLCLESDEAVLRWSADRSSSSIHDQPELFAYPAQSNMNGQRLPLEWCHELRQSRCSGRTYILLDAAAYCSTSPLDLSDADAAADFTVLSLQKIFGFPDLGILIVKRDAAQVFDHRRYFGGGTVDMVTCLKEQWHAKKSGPLHERLEDGTLAIHNILAVKTALNTHEELFGTLHRVAKHTGYLANQLYDALSSYKHSNGTGVCKVYKNSKSEYSDTKTQGPIVAFNLRDKDGNWVSTAEVEKLASIRDIHIRTGGLCNPGGVITALNLAPWEMRENFAAGHRCGGEDDILNGKPTGVIRISLGAMSTRSDVERFLAFIDEFFIDETESTSIPSTLVDVEESRFHVESLTVYPIKSCGGWQIPPSQSWEIRPEGLAWDREWCVVHEGTSKALSQKHHPRMALLRPELDFKKGTLRIGVVGSRDEINVPLSKNPNLYASAVRERAVGVCGDTINVSTYTSTAIADFFTRILGVACTLARFNTSSSVVRHSKLHLQSPAVNRTSKVHRPIMLSNESPILTISRSSLNRLNEQIKGMGGKAVHPSVFRANIILAESPLLAPGQEQPWLEDCWQGMRIGGSDGPLLNFLGGCRRCQMVCVDQQSAAINPEPFVTLAKTRRYAGRVLFGVHTELAPMSGRQRHIKAGDAVETFSDKFISEM